MALPDADGLLAAYAFLARRHSWAAAPSRTSAAAVATDARSLAESAEDQAAAVFFAIASRPRAFPGGWRTMAELFLTNVAAQHGTRIEASGEEIAALRVDVASRVADWPAVRDFLRARTVPL